MEIIKFVLYVIGCWTVGWWIGGVIGRAIEAGQWARNEQRKKCRKCRATFDPAMAIRAKRDGTWEHVDCEEGKHDVR